MAGDDPSVLAVRADRPVHAVVRFLSLSDIGAVADFVLMRAVTAGTAVAFAAAAE